MSLQGFIYLGGVGTGSKVECGRHVCPMIQIAVLNKCKNAKLEFHLN